MSTRCQILVKTKGLSWEDDEVMLYHHCDGYPEHMLECIKRGYQLSGKDWEAGRAGKIASFLCAAHPGSTEPESGQKFHGDIEYFYELTAINGGGGSIDERPIWEVKVYSTTTGFWDNPNKKHMKLVKKHRIG